MRINISTCKANTIIPFNHQHLLVGAINKWMGTNNEHGKISLYSFSRLNNVKVVKDGLQIEGYSSFFMSFHSNDLLKKIIDGIQTDPRLFLDLYVEEIVIQEDPYFENRELFLPGSPILLKRRVGVKIDHILYTDTRAANCLRETLETKMQIAGISDDSLSIHFDITKGRPGTKKVTYKGIENRVSWCPVVIKGKPETKLFAWNVGLGNSTGIGFGAII